MKTVVCFSVRVKSLTVISEKAVRIETFDGRSDIFPRSQIFGLDIESRKCDAYWISEWILEKKDIQWSRKKTRLVSVEDSGNLVYSPKFAGIVFTHTPEYVKPVESNEIESLRKPK